MPALQTNNTAAVDAFVATTHAARRLAAAITDHLDEHMGASPDDVNWAHVGSAGKVLGDLQEICRFLNIREEEVKG
jgi:hypothetical protein